MDKVFSFWGVPKSFVSIPLGLMLEMVFCFLLVFVFDRKLMFIPPAVFCFFRLYIFGLCFYGQERRKTPDEYSDRFQHLFFPDDPERHETCHHMHHRLRHTPAFHDLDSSHIKEKLDDLWDMLDRNECKLVNPIRNFGSVRGSLIMSLCNLLPFLFYAVWLSTAFIQPEIHTIIHEGNHDVVLDASNATNHYLRTCVYQLKSERTMLLRNQTIIRKHGSAAMETVMDLFPGMRDTVVEYRVPKVLCSSNSSWPVARLAAPYAPSIITAIMSFAVPLLFGVVVFSTMREMSVGSQHSLHIHESFHHLQCAVPDFFDACWFLGICFETTGINFAYLALNPFLFKELRYAFVWTYILALFETVLAFKLVTGWHFSSKNTQDQIEDEGYALTTSHSRDDNSEGFRHWLSKVQSVTDCIFEHPCFCSALSLCVNIPLGFLRLLMWWKGLQCSSIMIAKNAILILGAVSTLSTNDAENPISIRINTLTKSLPGFELLKEQDLKEAHKRDKAKMKNVLLELDDLVKDMKKVTDDERRKITEIKEKLKAIAKDEKPKRPEGILTYLRRRCPCIQLAIGTGGDDDDLGSARDVYFSGRHGHEESTEDPSSGKVLHRSGSFNNVRNAVIPPRTNPPNAPKRRIEID